MVKIGKKQDGKKMNYERGGRGEVKIRLKEVEVVKAGVKRKGEETRTEDEVQVEEELENGRRHKDMDRDEERG